MTKAVPDILARIVEQKAQELQRAHIPLIVLERLAESAARARRSFAGALRAKSPAVIAEIKKASPSKGVLNGNFQPAMTAVEYESGGAAAISVLTDREFFQGSLDDLMAARKAVNIPVLRKDFTTSKYHVVEAAANHADAILLIAAILTEQQMREFRELAGEWGMAALVEVHDAEELKPALASGAEIIGVNNRNLRTFEVTLETSLRLAEQIPSSVIKVSESGVTTREQIRQLQDAGYQAFLVGEHLMRSKNPRQALQALTA